MTNTKMQLQQPELLEIGESLVTTKTGRTVVARLIGRADAPLLDRLPPFHPNCRHFITPAPGALDERRRARELATA